MSTRIPPIQCLLTFEALARLRSVTQAAQELCVTPSAISHRVKQLEQLLGVTLFARADFSLTPDGATYLSHVRDGLSSLQRFPGARSESGRCKLRVAVTPTFARTMLMPRLRQFTEAYPEIDLSLQISIPMLDVGGDGADLAIRFGLGRYGDVEYETLLVDQITPVAAPLWLRENGPLRSNDDLVSAPLLRCSVEPWKTWFVAHDIDLPEPSEGSSFNDMGLMCDAAAQGLGVGLARARLTRAWLDSGQLIRIYERTIASPHAHYLCWRSGALERWECTIFRDWLHHALT